MIPIKDETRLIDLTIGELKSVLSNPKFRSILV